MHEVGVLSAMLKTLKDVMANEGLTHVEKVVLEVGELSGVVFHYIEECFPAAIYKTDFEDLKMEMKVVPGLVQCKSCNHTFNAFTHNLLCPVCSGENLIPLSGRDFIIKEIVAC